MRDNQKICQGFTLVELLTVIAVISILIGIVMPAVNTARTRAFSSKTAGSIAALELAFSMYDADVGTFPVQATQGYVTASWLTTDIGTTGWDGPYIEFKDEALDTAEVYVIDAWGNAFYYQSPGTHNTQSFDVWSAGQDGVYHSYGSDSVDNDITNWT